MKPKRKTVTLRLPKSIDNGIETIAKLAGVSKGDTVCVLLALAMLQRTRAEYEVVPRPASRAR